MSLTQYNLAVAVFLGLYFGIPAFLLLLYLFRRFRVVEQGTSMVVERFGRFHRRCDAGLHFLVPFIDRTRPVVWRSTEVFNQKDRSWSNDVTQRVRIRQTRSDVIDMRESILDFPSQTVVTRDNVRVHGYPCQLGMRVRMRARALVVVRMRFGSHHPPSPVRVRPHVVRR